MEAMSTLLMGATTVSSHTPIPIEILSSERLRKLGVLSQPTEIEHKRNYFGGKPIYVAQLTEQEYALPQLWKGMSAQTAELTG